MARTVKLMFNVFSVIVYLQGSFTYYQNTRNCGFQRADLAPEFSITGGGEAQEGEWPWQVALLHEDTFLCGGQLIKEDWVLTAAHCITHLNNPEAHRIMMGSIHLNNFTEEPNTQLRTVVAFYPHPDYSTLISDYDLALINVESPFEMTDYVTTVCLAKRGMEDIYDPGTAMTVTGWGAQRDMGPLPKTLREVTIPMVNHETCRRMYFGEDDITPNMICAAPEEGGKGSCGGDSGGPLVTKIGDQWWLAGTVLGGNGCGSPDFPNVFQNVIAFQNWIEPIFNNRLPDGQITNCGEDEFSCKEGWCIEYYRRCNVREDCQLATDELYCEAELKLFDVQFDRRLSYRNIIRNISVPSSLECAKECVKTVVPMKCGAFDTTPGPNNTRVCSIGSEAYSTKRMTHEERERYQVSHFSYRFSPEPKSELTYHVGVIMSPNLLGNRKTGYFNWILNLNAPDSNTILFTVLSVRSQNRDCEDLQNMAMLVVKPGQGKRRNRKKNKDSTGETSVNYCLAELEVGDQFRVHNLYARLFFYTTHPRRFAFSIEYQPEYNCTKTITSPRRLRSPNYPAKYPPSLECKWIYKAPPGMTVSVEMDDFLVEKVPDCEFDYVQIFDGPTTTDRQLTGRRCGMSWTDTITSSGNQLLIYFISDSEVVKTGFQATISFNRAGGRRRSQRLTAGDNQRSDAIHQQAIQDTNVILYSLWGTAIGSLLIISVLAVVLYKLKKRLDATNALARNVKRNNVVFDSH